MFHISVEQHADARTSVLKNVITLSIAHWLKCYCVRIRAVTHSGETAKSAFLDQNYNLVISASVFERSHHRGDAACVLPARCHLIPPLWPSSLSKGMCQETKFITLVWTLTS